MCVCVCVWRFVISQVGTEGDGRGQNGRSAEGKRKEDEAQEVVGIAALLIFMLLLSWIVSAV